MGAVTVNPVQTVTYDLNADNNPITFGTGTNIAVSSTDGDGVVGLGATLWSVTNLGTISATGSDNTSGVDIDNGTVTNQSGGKISGFGFGIVDGDFEGTLTVTNSGDIRGSEGISLFNAGTVHNLSGGTISGGTVSGNAAVGGAILISGSGDGLVTNAGTINGGVYLGSGTVDNYNGGTISGVNAVNMSGRAEVTNAGSIVGASDGAGVEVGYLGAGATVDNQVGGTITGLVGVDTGAAGSVTNAGTISGSLASVRFGAVLTSGGANTLTLQTGSRLSGDAIGSTASGATNTLVLQGSGEADNNFKNFTALNVQASGDWTLGGDSTIGSATVSSGNLIVTGDLDLTQNLTGSVTIGHGGALKLEVGPALDSSIDFQNAGTLSLAQAYGGTVSGFGAHDLIDLTNLHYDSSASHYSVSNGNGPDEYLVTVFEGANSLSVQFRQSTPVTEAEFTLKQDASSDTELLYGSTGKPVNFNGDILFQNTSSGQASIWEMNGNTLVGGGAVTPNPGPSWTEIGTGDFNHDGRSDILWQNANGQASVWEMNGSSLIGGGPVTPSPGPAWKAIGTGDFTDDGFADDILWQNKNSGQVSVWEMSGNKLTGGGPVSPNPGPAWKAIGTGDFNDDGHSDVLFQNTSSGQVSIWEMNGNTLIGGGAVSPNPGPAWKAIGTGDFNDDGHSDILFQNKSSGQVSIWQMNGNKLTGGGPVSPNPGPSWHAIGLT